MKKILSLLILFALAVTMTAESEQYRKVEKTYRYRIYFTDKKHNNYSTRHPEEFLSQKALARRKKLKIKVDKFDLPVTQLYLEYLNKNNIKVVNVSKWNNTAVVEVSDRQLIEGLKEVAFIKDTKQVWESSDSILIRTESDRTAEIENRRDTLISYYGKSEHQLQMLQVPQLHELGLKGEGMTIAVIDGGFYNTDIISGLKDCKIKGTRNFVHPEKSVYEEPQQHGTMVLSCMAAQLPFGLVGSAPEAEFYLLVSEDNDSENLIEEDNWCAALEYADSLGVDIVTSSLGYHCFDDISACHKYHEMNGETAINSKSASLAASRGLVVVNSAGNEGDTHWKKLGFPGDAKDIFTVGAVNRHKVNTLFSSLGNTADGRIKPDIMAQGEDTALLDFQGNVTTANGTSFSAPLFCGALACLMQAFPQAKPLEIIHAVQQAGDQAEHPNNVYGYGIPNMYKAYEFLKKK